jgi:hypothetical protein
VVPHLGRVVEHAALAPHDDLLERLVRLGLAVEQLVQVRHVRGVVLAVVELQRLRAGWGFQPRAASSPEALAESPGPFR